MDKALYERERRDVNDVRIPTKHDKWVESMLHDVGTDVNAIGRDFSRLTVKLRDVDYTDPDDVEADMLVPAAAAQSHRETFAEREERVFNTILGIIAVAEASTDDVWNPRYYRVRCGASRLESPLNVESTVAGLITPREDPLQGEKSLIRIPSLSGTPLNTATLTETEVDKLLLTTDNLHQHDADDSEASPLLAPSSVHTGRPRKGSLLYNPLKASSHALLPEDEPLRDENGTELDDTNDKDGRRRQRAAVARFLRQFREQWAATSEEEQQAMLAAGSNMDHRGADLSKRLSQVFHQAGMSKKVLLTNAQHRILLDARFRHEVEEAEAVRDPHKATSPRVARRAIAARRKEEAIKARLGLVGDLQANSDQKTKRMEADARVQALIAERIPPSPMVKPKVEEALEEESSMCSSIPFNELSPLKEHTGLPQRRTTDTPDTHGGGGPKGSNNNSFGLKNETSNDGGSEQIVADEDCLDGSLDSADYLPGQMHREASQPQNKNGDNNIGHTSFESANDASDESDKEIDLPTSSEAALLASASAAAAATGNDAGKKAPSAAQETLIANCRTIDVLLYFCQGVMFFPSQRMHYLLWHPWLGHLRDLGWEARIFTTDVKIEDVVPEFKDFHSQTPSVKQFSAASKSPKSPNDKPLIKTPAVSAPPDLSGLIFIRHTQAVSNFVPDDKIGDIPEMELAWSLEITLSKKTSDSPSSAASITFVDAHLVVHYCHIEEVGGFGCCGGGSPLWRARAANLEHHVFDTFGVTTRYVRSLMGIARAMHFEAELLTKEDARGQKFERGSLPPPRRTIKPSEATPLLSGVPPVNESSEERSIES